MALARSCGAHMQCGERGREGLASARTPSSLPDAEPRFVIMAESWPATVVGAQEIFGRRNTPARFLPPYSL